MRQGQQNRRGRGRNRKAHHNPLTRSYELNGPDVKIRGTPAHIAEKYMSLARDALASGDPVLAENYLQHAEHYNRIIMAYREQTVQQAGESMNGAGRHRSDVVDADDYLDDDADEAESYAVPRGQEPQPRMDGNGRMDDRHQQENGRPSRNRFEEQRASAAEDTPQPTQQVEVAEQSAIEASRQPRSETSQRRRDRFASSMQEQPEFLRRPVRRARREANGGSSDQSNGAGANDDAKEQ